jgi:cutinase
MLPQILLAAALVGTALSTPLKDKTAASPERRTSIHDKRQQDFSGDTQNGLTQGGCKSVVVVFARGTTESGNVGTLAGPPMFQAVAQKVGAGNLAVQGVQYPANVQGFLAGGDATGSKTMADLVTKAVTQCANSSVIMSGYSQGGQLVHNAAKMLPAATTAKVAGVVIFGDPSTG